MPFAMRQSGRVALAVLSAACAALSLPAFAQQPEPEVSSRYLQLEHTSSAQLSPADLSLLHSKRAAIGTEAAFFGYDLSAGAWDYDAATCPLMPGQLIVHYRRHFPNGAASIFTALVPRAAGRVWVVPVLYRNALPFHSAMG